MSAVQPFDFDGHQIRARVEGDEAVFVAADVASILGYSDTAAMTRYLDVDEKGLSIWQTPGGSQRMSHVTEAGLYAAVMRSTSPQAKPFRRWVTHEVLPAIRRTGTYSTAPALPQTYADALRELAATVEAREAALAQVEALTPSAAAWDRLHDGRGDYAIRQAALILNRDPSIKTGERRLFATLADLGWIYRHRGAGGAWTAYQVAIERGRLAHLAQDYTDPEGVLHIKPPQVRVTVKGLRDLHRHLGGTSPLALDDALLTLSPS